MKTVMPATDAYVDTSALIKCFVPEPFSDEVEQYLATLSQPCISTLTIVEWNCAMSRRRRDDSISDTYYVMARREFERQLADGLFRLHQMSDGIFRDALALIDQVDPIPLRTLDALHLAVAKSAGAACIVTADQTMAKAARYLGLTVRAYLNKKNG